MKMKVMNVNFVVLLFAALFPGIVQGIIRNHEKNIIREEERRGASSLKNYTNSKPDQDTYPSVKRDTWAIGLNRKHQPEDCHHCQPSGYGGEVQEDQGQQGYGLVGPDNLGHPLGSVGQFVTNTRINEPSGYGFGHSSGGIGASYGYGGGAIGHSAGGIGNFGYGGGGINHFGYDGGVGNYGHSGGGIGSYGHSAVGHDYGHSGGGYSGLTGLIHKKISLKKLILPIAAIALLGAAAAMTTNPVLLQLGTISGRKKRSISENIHLNSFPRNPFVRPNRVQKLRK